MKPKLLIIELWGLGDLAIATPFLRKASEHFDVTLLAKSYAHDLQKRFWPGVKVISFNAPWTAFNNKYNLFRWSWRSMFSVWRQLRRERFDVGLSARWDPRDHFLLQLSGAKTRLGFPRLGSGVFLTRPLAAADQQAHRYESWRVIAQALNLKLEKREQLLFPQRHDNRVILIHTGAAQPVRVWPLENYLRIVRRLRGQGHTIRILCNPEQKEWWQSVGETNAIAPKSIGQLIDLLDEAAVFVGNDSGPGHVAAICGLPTFTLFGDQVAEWFLPLHPAAEFHEGKACPYKPCSDYCRFPTPRCLTEVTEAEIWPRVDAFIRRHLNISALTEQSNQEANYK